MINIQYLSDELPKTYDIEKTLTQYYQSEILNLL